jgi:hypothetical protein
MIESHKQGLEVFTRHKLRWLFMVLFHLLGVLQRRQAPFPFWPTGKGGGAVLAAEKSGRFAIHGPLRSL